MAIVVSSGKCGHAADAGSICWPCSLQATTRLKGRAPVARVVEFDPSQFGQVARPTVLAVRLGPALYAEVLPSELRPWLTIALRTERVLTATVDGVAVALKVWQVWASGAGQTSLTLTDASYARGAQAFGARKVS